jgi:peroxiredoxin
MARDNARRLPPGHLVAPLALVTVDGEPIAVPDPDRLVHLQFRRFAGCPVCNLHLRSVARRHAEIEAAGVREVVFFHSEADELRQHTVDLPFAVIADPDRRWYRMFGVEAARRALLDPRAWGPIVGSITLDLVRVARRGQPLPSTDPTGGRIGLPADFLLDGDGRVLAAKYGDHAYDQWSVDELLDLARVGVPR